MANLMPRFDNYTHQLGKVPTVVSVANYIDPGSDAVLVVRGGLGVCKAPMRKTISERMMLMILSSPGTLMAVSSSIPRDRTNLPGSMRFTSAFMGVHSLQTAGSPAGSDIHFSQNRLSGSLSLIDGSSFPDPVITLPVGSYTNAVTDTRSNQSTMSAGYQISSYVTQTGTGGGNGTAVLMYTIGE